MARPRIEYPCGCVVNETHVIAMCLRHDQELRTQASEQRREQDRIHAELRSAIEGLK